MLIETERLTIRSFRKDDIDDYYQVVRDDRVTRYLGDGAPHDRETAANYVLDCIEREYDEGLTRYAVVWKQTDKLIGFSGFKRIAGKVDFGYRLAHSFWGQGLATEAGKHVLQYGWSELALTEVVAGVIEGNAASIAVLRKLSFCDWRDPSLPDDRFLWFRLTN